MNLSALMLVLVATLGLSACERQHAVVTAPAPSAKVGPAGPQGASGVRGNAGQPGESGKTGAGTVIVKPLPPTALEVT